MRSWPVLAVLLLAVAPATLASPPEYRYVATDCAYDYSLVPTLAERVRPFLPPRFTMTGDPAAIVVVTFVRCDFALNGAPPHTATISDVGVLVDPPTGVAGALDFYSFWRATDSRTLAAIDQEWGFAAEFVESIAFDRSATTPATATVDARIDSVFGAYEQSGTYGPIHEAVPGTAQWWRESDGGLVVLAQVFTDNDVEEDGLGTIDAAPGTPLAAMVGESALAQTSVSFVTLVGQATFIPDA